MTTAKSAAVLGASTTSKAPAPAASTHATATPDVVGCRTHDAFPRLEPGEPPPPLLPAQERAWVASLQRTRGNQATAALLREAVTSPPALALEGWAPLQRKRTGGAETEAETVHEIAARGTSGAGVPLPYLVEIQRSFGRRDVTSVMAHTDGSAREAARALGAEAFTTGEHVAFAREPSLHTAAHEAAHVIQQRAGVQLKGGVGAVGDPYERHADAVADAVVMGKSSEALLESLGGAGRPASRSVQFEETSRTPVSSASKPAQGASQPISKKWDDLHTKLQTLCQRLSTSINRSLIPSAVRGEWYQRALSYAAALDDPDAPNATLLLMIEGRLDDLNRDIARDTELAAQAWVGLRADIDRDLRVTEGRSDERASKILRRELESTQKRVTAVGELVVEDDFRPLRETRERNRHVSQARAEIEAEQHGARASVHEEPAAGDGPSDKPTPDSQRPSRIKDFANGIANGIVSTAHSVDAVARFLNNIRYNGLIEIDLPLGEVPSFLRQLDRGLRLLHVDGGLSAYARIPFFDPMLPRGSNWVHLKIGLDQRFFSYWWIELRAETIELAGINLPRFDSENLRLNQVYVRYAHDHTADISIDNASMSRAVFKDSVAATTSQAKDSIEAEELGLNAIQLDAFDVEKKSSKYWVLNLNFNEAHLHGLRYPGIPTTDINIKRTDLNFLLLSKLVADKSKESSPLPPGPEILPIRGRIQIDLDGLTASPKVDLDERSVVRSGGGFKHLHVKLIAADGGDLAAITVDGFHATVGGEDPGGGTIEKLTVKGEPAAVKALLASRPIAADPRVAQALDITRKYGIQSIGGTFTLRNVGAVAGRDGRDAAKGDFDALLDVPDLGALDVKLHGFSLAGFVAEPRSLKSFDFDLFSAQLKDKGGAELAYVAATYPKPGGAQVSGARTGGARSVHFVARGDVAGLVEAARKPLQAWRPQVLGALEKVCWLGSAPGGAGGGKGKVPGEAAPKLGEKTAQGPLPQAPESLPRDKKIQIEIDGPAVPPLDLVTGAKAGAGDFDLLRVTLGPVGGIPLASITVQGFHAAPDGTKQGIRIEELTVKGESALVKIMIESAAVAAQPRVRDVLDIINRCVPRVGAGTVKLKPLFLTVDSDPAKTTTLTTPKLDVQVDSPDGVLLISIDAFEVADGIVSYEGFKTFTLDLKNKAGEPLAHASFGETKISKYGTGKFDDIVLSGDVSKLLKAAQEATSKLSPRVRHVLDTVRRLGLKGDVSGKVHWDPLPDGSTKIAGDINAKVKGVGGGELDVSVKGFERLAPKGGEEAIAFKLLTITLKRDGFAAVSFSAEGEVTQGTGKKFAVHIKEGKASGDAASLNALFNAASNNVKLPEEVNAVFATMRKFGLLGQGDISLKQVDLARTQDGLRAKGDLTAGFTLPGAGSVRVEVHRFAGSHAQASTEALFDSFDVKLWGANQDSKGAPAAHLRIERSKADIAGEAVGGADKPRNVSFVAKKIEAEGSSEALASLLNGVKDQVKLLPAAVIAAFEFVLEHGSELKAKGSVSLTDVDLSRKDGILAGQADGEIRLAVPNVGTLTVTLKGRPKGQQAGLALLDLKLADQKGGQAARLQVRGISVDSKGSIQLGPIFFDGDAARLAAVLDSQVLKSLPVPPAIDKWIARLDGKKFFVTLGDLTLKRNLSGALRELGTSFISIRGAVRFVDKKGAVYRCTDASLEISGAKSSQFGRDGIPTRITAESLSVTGPFSIGTINGKAKLSTGKAVIKLGPGGVPLSVNAEDIHASGEITMKSAPTPLAGKEEPNSTLHEAEQIAKDAAPLIKDATIDINTPLYPGIYGRSLEVRVMAGSMLHAQVMVRDYKLTAATTVKFNPPPKLLGGIRIYGAFLTQEGDQGLLMGKSFVKLNVSEYLSGRKSISLDLRALVNEIVATLQISENKPKPTPMARTVDADASWLKEKRADWAATREQHAAEAVNQSAAEKKKIADEDAGYEPRSASALDLLTKGFNLLGTAGTVDLTLSPKEKAVTIMGVTVPAGKIIHLFGVSQGGGLISLMAAEASVETGGNVFTATGLTTGDVKLSTGAGGTHIEFTKFSLEALRWEAPP